MNTRILIVEDEIIVAYDMKATLEKLGYEVIGIESNGEKALETFRKFMPTLVMMDIRIRGDMDGIQTAERMRALKSVPVIFLTAYADDETLDRAKRIEPFGYLIKPYQERDLRTTIEIALYKHDIEHQLAEQKEWLQTTLLSISDAVVTTDTNGCITFMNPIAEAYSEWKMEDAKGLHLHDVLPIHDDRTAEPLTAHLEAILQEGKVIRLNDNSILLSKNNAQLSIAVAGSPIVLDDGEIVGAVYVLRDVTEKRRLEQEREVLIIKLQKALDEVKTLQGLIPICSVCKKVRDDEGFWKEVEEYVGTHTDATFTHGLCPDCLRRIYPELVDEVLGSAEAEK